MVRKVIITIITIASLLIATMLMISNSIDYNVVVKSLANEIDISANAIKTIKIKKFPLPSLVINRVEEKGKLELEKVEIHFDLYSLLKLTPKVKGVKIHNAKIYLEYSKVNAANHEQIISSLLTKEFSNINFNIINLNILNKENESIVILSNCHLAKTHILSEMVSFKGMLDNRLQFAGTIEQKANYANFDLTLYNRDYNFHLLETYKDSKLVSGKGEYIIQNLASVLTNFIPDLKSLFRRFNQEVVKIKFDISPADQLLKLENVDITANSFLGKGLIHLSKKENINTIINLTFPKIDIQALILPLEKINKFVDLTYGVGIGLDNKLLEANISAEQIILAEGEVLNNTQLLLNSEDSVLQVKDFSGLIQSGGKFQFIGNITHNTVRSIFDGTVYLQHKDLNNILDAIGYKQVDSGKTTPFSLFSNLKLTLIDIYLQNLSIKTEDTNVTGDITTRFIGFMPHIMANLEFSSLNLARDNYPIISPMINFAKSLVHDVKSDTYLAKYIPIRTIECLGNFDITVNEMSIGDKEFGKIYMLATIAPGIVEINSFDLRKDDVYLNLTAKLLASSLKPQLEVKIKDGSLTIEDWIKPNTLLVVRNKLLDEFDLEKVELKLKCELSKLVQGNLIFKNFKLALANDNTLFNINNLEADILSGKLKATGNILLDPYTLSFVYALNSMNLAQLSSLLPQGMLDTYGGISFNGKFSTNGDSLEKLFYNLTTESEFIAKNTKINNFSMDDLIEKVNAKDYNFDNLKNDVAIAISQGYTTIDNWRGNLLLKNGIASFKDMLFKTKYISGAASMSLNIYNYELALTSILSFYINNKQLDNLQVNKKTSPTQLQLNASGSIFNPLKTIDDTELKKFFVNKKR